MVADDVFLSREGVLHVLARVAGLESVAAVASLDDLRAAVTETRPDVVVTGIGLPPTRSDEGIRFASELRTIQPEAAVLVLSDNASREFALALFKGGASRRGYLLKNRLVDERYLVEAIETVAEGGSWMDARIVELVTRGGERSGVQSLTDDEVGVLALVSEGLTNDAIAQRLGGRGCRCGRGRSRHAGRCARTAR